jgi:hypothetical protein
MRGWKPLATIACSALMIGAGAGVVRAQAVAPPQGGGGNPYTAVRKATVAAD